MPLVALQDSLSPLKISFSQAARERFDKEVEGRCVGTEDPKKLMLLLLVQNVTFCLLFGGGFLVVEPVTVV